MTYGEMKKRSEADAKRFPEIATIKNYGVRERFYAIAKLWQHMKNDWPLMPEELEDDRVRDEYFDMLNGTDPNELLFKAACGGSHLDYQEEDGTIVNLSTTDETWEMVEHYVNQASYIVEPAWGDYTNLCMCRVSGKGTYADGHSCNHAHRDVGGCIFMGEGARQIYGELKHELTKEEALEKLRKAREAGLRCGFGYGPPDSYHLYKIYPPNSVMTVCLCCDECCLMAYQNIMNEVAATTQSGVGELAMFKPYTANIDACVGCGICKNRCPHHSPVIENGKVVLPEVCLGCGACASVCPNDVIHMLVKRKDYKEFIYEQLDCRCTVNENPVVDNPNKFFVERAVAGDNESVAKHSVF